MPMRSDAPGLTAGLIALLAATCLTFASFSAASFASAAAPPAPEKSRKPEKKEFDQWLVQIQYCHRLDKVVADQDDGAARKQGEKGRGRPHAIYGWSVEADAAGKPVDSTRSMTGFIIADTKDNNQVIAEVQKAHARGKPALIALKREGSADLFTFSGRHWYQIEHAIAPPAETPVSDAAPFRVPPEEPMTRAQKREVSASLHYERSSPSDKGTTLHRYRIRIAFDQPPPNAARLRLWIGSHLEINGSRIGPIVQPFEIGKSSKGGFSLNQSFEFIAAPGTKLNPDATTIEPVAIAWE